MLLTRLILLLANTAFAVDGLTSSSANLKKKNTKEHVIVVGGGIGGLSTAFELSHLLPKDTKISVISNRSTFQFTPSNPWVSIGTRTAKDISIPMSKACKAGHVDYIPGELRVVDAKNKQIGVLLEGHDSLTNLPYDYLVGATGPKLEWQGLLDPEKGSSVQEGTEMVVAEVSVCTTPHAEQTLQSYEKFVEKGGGHVVIGALQGASCFGPAYEYAMMLDKEFRDKGIRESTPMTFVTSEPYIGHLGLAGAGDSYEILTKRLAEHDIRVLTNCAVNRLDRTNGKLYVTQTTLPEGEVEAHAHAGEKMFPWKKAIGTKEHVLPVNFIMMIPQFHGQSCWQEASKGVADAKGMIYVDEFMRNPTYPDIYGVGVCVHFDPVESTPVATGAPKTGYLIESMGSAATRNIRATILSRRANVHSALVETSRLKRPSLDTLCLTDFGGMDGGAFLASPEMPPRKHDQYITGGIVKLAKIAFEKYFLFKVRSGNADPYYEKFLLKLLGIERLDNNSS